MQRRSFAFAVLVSLLISIAASKTTAAPLPIDIAALQPNFGEHAVIKEYGSIGTPSPDGKYFAYTQCIFHEDDPTKNGLFPGPTVGCALVIADARAGEILQHFASGTFGPVWSPDGSALAFSCPNNQKFGMCTWSMQNKQVVSYPALVIDDYYSTFHWVSNTQLVVDSANALLSGELPQTASPVVAEEITKPVVYRTAQNLAADPRRGPYDVPPVSVSFLPSHGPKTLYLADINGGLRKLTTMERVPTSTANADLAPGSPYLAIAENSGMFSDIRQRAANGTLRIIDVRTGKTAQSFSHLVQNAAQIAWAPNGSAVAWYGQDEKAKSIKIYAARLTGPVRIVSTISTTSPPPSTGMMWTTDSSHILTLVKVGVFDRGFPSSILRNALWVTDVSTGKSHAVFFDPNERIIRVIPQGQRMAEAWGQAGSGNIALITQSLTDLSYSLITLNPQTGARKKVLSENALYAFPGGDTLGRNLYFLRERADLAQDIYAFDPARDRSPRAITHVMDRFRPYPLGKSRLLSYTVNGKKLHAAILLPPGYRSGTRLPAVVYLYGGSYSAQDRLNQFGLGEYDTGLENLQVLATRGIAVIVPDTPYSGNDLMEEDLTNATAAMNAAYAHGYTLWDHFGVMGHSHGGYDVFALMAQSNRFKAGVARAGLADWTNFGTELNRPFDRSSGTTGNAKATTAMPRYGLGIDLWTNPQRYLAESPIYRFNHVTGAVLIIHAAADQNVLPQQAEAAFSAFLQLDKNAELAIYPQGNHTEDTWPMKYQIDYVQRMVDWFQRYLR